MKPIGPCEACGETHELRPTPVYGEGIGAMLCDVCYTLNVDMNETPRWSGRPDE